MNFTEARMQAQTDSPTYFPLARRLTWTISFWMLCLTTPLDLNAQPIPLLRVSVLPGYGWGKSTEVGGSGKTIQPYLYGLGFRLEYVFESRVSLGILLMAYVGESVAIISSSGDPLTLKTKMRHGGIEAGYEVVLAPRWVLRPRLGVGIGEPAGNFSAELAGTNDVSTVSAAGVRPYFEFGVGTFVEMGSSLFAGIDLGYITVADYRNANSFVIRGIIGFVVTNNH